MCLFSGIADLESILGTLVASMHAKEKQITVQEIVYFSDLHNLENRKI